MKFLFNISFVLLLGLLSSSAYGQNVVTEKFWVGGTCDMCKERIETALDTTGVKYAEYDVQTHTLEITYSTKKITADQIHDRLNAIGHDTSRSKASDEAYANIHSCCKYRDHDHGEEHDDDHKSSCSSSCKDTKCTDKKSEKSCSDKDCKDKKCKDKKKKSKKGEEHDHEDH